MSTRSGSADIRVGRWTRLSVTDMALSVLALAGVAIVGCQRQVPPAAPDTPVIQKRAARFPVAADGGASAQESAQPASEALSKPGPAPSASAAPTNDTKLAFYGLKIAP